MDKPADKDTENTASRMMLPQLFDFLFGTSAESRERRKLKQMGKQLRKKRYRYLSLFGDQLTPAFADYLYTIYKITSPFSAAYNKVRSPELLTYLIICYAVPEEIIHAIDELDEDEIRRKSETMSYHELYDNVRKNVDELKVYFEKNQFSDVDAIYRDIVTFRSFCMYDYYYILRRFSGGMTENDFRVKPAFHKENGIDLLERISDFAGIASAFASIENLDAVIRFSEQITNNAASAVPALDTLHKSLKKHQADNVFETICKIIKRSNAYPIPVFDPGHNATGKWLNMLTKNAGTVLHDIHAKQQQAFIESAAAAVFGGLRPLILKNYTSVRSGALEERHMGKFKYVMPVGYLQLFYRSESMKQLTSFMEMLTIKGKPSAPERVKNIFDLYHQFNDVELKIEKLDAQISPASQYGYEIDHVIKQKLIPDSLRLKVIRDIDIINAEAASILRTGGNYLKQLGKSVEALEKDSEKPYSEIISNWDELDKNASQPVKETLRFILAKITGMSSLLDAFNVPEEKTK
jgi:hypothetical protein